MTNRNINTQNKINALITYINLDRDRKKLKVNSASEYGHLCSKLYMIVKNFTVFFRRNFGLRAVVSERIKLNGTPMFTCNQEEHDRRDRFYYLLLPFFLRLAVPHRKETNESSSFRYFHPFRAAERPTVQLPLAPRSDMVQQCGDRRPDAGFRYRLSHAGDDFFFFCPAGFFRAQLHRGVGVRS